MGECNAVHSDAMLGTFATQYPYPANNLATELLAARRELAELRERVRVLDERPLERGDEILMAGGSFATVENVALCQPYVSHRIIRIPVPAAAPESAPEPWPTGAQFLVADDHPHWPACSGVVRGKSTTDDRYLVDIEGCIMSKWMAPRDMVGAAQPAPSAVEDAMDRFDGATAPTYRGYPGQQYTLDQARIILGCKPSLEERLARVEAALGIEPHPEAPDAGRG